MKKVLVAGIHHESNTFNPILTDEIDFSILRGEEIIANLNKSDSISGVVETLQDAGCQVVPAILARAVPNGVVSKKLYLSLKEEMLKRARENGPYDGIALAIHGSMRVEEIGEAEGDYLTDLRKLFPDTPISASLDMHGTITDAMIDNLDACVGYKQAPHTDCYETGAHASRMLLDMLDQGSKPVTAWTKLPLLIAGEKTETSVEPMRQLIEILRQAEKRDGILAASYLLGFPWADCQENGVSVVVVAENDPKKAEDLTRELAAAFWKERRNFKFHTDSYDEEKAIEEAYKAAQAGAVPVYLSDSGDNPTAGSSADCTGFLSKLLAYKPLKELDKPVIFAGIYDPNAVRRCFELGEGATFEGSVGAVFDTKTSSPLNVRGRIAALRAGWEKFSTDMVRLELGSLDLILVSKHIGFVSPDMFEALGKTVSDYSIITVKLGYLTAYHKVHAKTTIMALSKGSSNEVLETLPYTKLQRPIFPLDPDCDYTDKIVFGKRNI